MCLLASGACLYGYPSPLFTTSTLLWFQSSSNPGSLHGIAHTCPSAPSWIQADPGTATQLPLQTISAICYMKVFLCVLWKLENQLTTKWHTTAYRTCPHYKHSSQFLDLVIVGVSTGAQEGLIIKFATLPVIFHIYHFFPLLQVKNITRFTVRGIFSLSRSHLILNNMPNPINWKS